MCFKERCKTGIELFWQHPEGATGLHLTAGNAEGSWLFLAAAGVKGGRGRCQEALELSGSAGETRAPLQEATKPFSNAGGERRTSRKSGHGVVVEGGCS